MKFTLHLFLLTLLIALAFAADPQKHVIVSYPDNTPASVVEEAKNAIIKAGGIIEHEYHLIKAFAAQAPATILETVQTLGSQNNVVIEEDQTVSANNS